MKKLIVMAVMMAGFAVAANAQQAPPAGKTTPEARKNMKHELQLSKAQGKDLKETRKMYKDKMQAVKNDKSLTKQQQKEQLGSINKERKEKMGAILTPEQMQKMEAMKKNHTHKNRQSRPVTTK